MCDWISAFKWSCSADTTNRFARIHRYIDNNTHCREIKYSNARLGSVALSLLSRTYNVDQVFFKNQLLRKDSLKTYTACAETAGE